MIIGLVSISDRASAGVYKDEGIPSLKEWLAAGEAVDPALYYMRTTPLFETGDARYAWLNRMVCVATGARRAAAVELDVYEVL